MFPEKPSLDELQHFGVKGMRWGVRKDQPTGGFRLQSSNIAIDSGLHPSTKKAGADVAKLMGSRYGFQITQVKTLGPGHSEYTPGNKGTMAFVEHTPGKSGGVIYVKAVDLRKPTATAEKNGFFAPGTGTPTGLFTHESAHALFHASQDRKVSVWTGKVKTTSEHQAALDKSMKEAFKAAKQDGVPMDAHGLNFASSVSGYARHAMVHEEIEAELFSQYHWNPNPPRFVKVWGETLHQELGVDATPFREVVKRG